MGSRAGKVCPRCGLEKPQREFAIKTGTRRQVWCKECARIWARAHYQKNKPYFRERNRRSRERKKAHVDALKLNPCTDCGQTFPPYVMEFDHVRLKRDAIRKLCSTSWRILLAEIAKCELVCANCHAARTWRRRQTPKNARR